MTRSFLNGSVAPNDASASYSSPSTILDSFARWLHKRRVFWFAFLFLMCVITINISREEVMNLMMMTVTMTKSTTSTYTKKKAKTTPWRKSTARAVVVLPEQYNVHRYQYQHDDWQDHEKNDRTIHVLVNNFVYNYTYSVIATIFDTVAVNGHLENQHINVSSTNNTNTSSNDTREGNSFLNFRVELPFPGTYEITVLEARGIRFEYNLHPRIPVEHATVRVVLTNQTIVDSDDTINESRTRTKFMRVMKVLDPNYSSIVCNGTTSTCSYFRNNERITFSIVNENDEKEFIQQYLEHRYQTLPPCQSLSSPIAMTSFSGFWLGPRAMMRRRSVHREQQREYQFQTMARTGWVYLPENCRMDIFTTRDLHNIVSYTEEGKQHPQHDDTISSVRRQKKMTSIVILGTSRERGIFLSLVDLLLAAKDKINLSKSVVGKCWGRAVVDVGGKIRIIYQDTRTNEMNPTEAANEVTCHNEKIAMYPGMFRNATLMVKSLFELPSSEMGQQKEQAGHRQPEDYQFNLYQPPDVILLMSGCADGGIWKTRNVTEWLKCQDVFNRLTRVLPQDWNGTLYALDGAGFNAFTKAVNRTEYKLYRQMLEDWNRLLADKKGDSRIRMIDTLGLSSAMSLYAEYPGKLHHSTHWHRFCFRRPHPSYYDTYYDDDNLANNNTNDSIFSSGGNIYGYKKSKNESKTQTYPVVEEYAGESTRKTGFPISGGDSNQVQRNKRIKVRHQKDDDLKMVVCSNVTEILAQLLLTRALAPDGIRVRVPSHSAKIEGNMNTDYSRKYRKTKNHLNVCTDCPAALLPHHIKVHPNLNNCRYGPFVPLPANILPGEVWDGLIECPSKCLSSNKSQIGTLQTQSDVVAVRQCSI